MPARGGAVGLLGCIYILREFILLDDLAAAAGSRARLRAALGIAADTSWMDGRRRLVPKIGMRRGNAVRSYAEH